MKVIPSRQAIYDRVKKHAIKQGDIAYDCDGDACYYRTLTGCKCAIGCLIDDEHYTPLLEGLSVNDNLVIKALVASGIISLKEGDDLLFLESIQSSHDIAMNHEEWLQNLSRVAREYELSAISTQSPDFNRGVSRNHDQ